MNNGYCNCIKDSKSFSVSKFRIVQTCNEGICENCGHYTLQSPKIMQYVSTKKPRGRKGLDDKIKEEIKVLLGKGIKGKVIAQKFGVPPSKVSEIKNER